MFDGDLRARRGMRRLSVVAIEKSKSMIVDRLILSLSHNINPKIS